MSDAVIIALITNVTGLVTLVITLLLRQKLAKVHHEINGHMTELKRLAKVEGKAIGKQEEKADQKERDHLTNKT